MNNSAAHQKLVDDILFAFGSRPDVRVHTVKVGLAVPIGSNRPVYFGLKGESDIQGIVCVLIKGQKVGIFLAIEVKTGSGKLSKDQGYYKAMVLNMGGIFIEARSVKESLQYLNSVIQSLQG